MAVSTLLPAEGRATVNPPPGATFTRQSADSSASAWVSTASLGVPTRLDAPAMKLRARP